MAWRRIGGKPLNELTMIINNDPVHWRICSSQHIQEFDVMCSYVHISYSFHGINYLMLQPSALKYSSQCCWWLWRWCSWGCVSWWRHQMEAFSALLAICAGNSPIPGEFPTQRPVTRSFDVYFDLRPNKRLSKQLWGWWFETQSRSLWRHRNVTGNAHIRSLTVLYKHFFFDR